VNAVATRVALWPPKPKELFTATRTFFFARDVWRVIEVAVLTRVFQIDRRRNHGISNGKRARGHFHGTGAERQNLTMRMSMRRLRRLTNGFSKKLENHEHALVFYFMYYNFCRIH
jgi:IS1 family transposase